MNQPPRRQHRVPKLGLSRREREVLPLVATMGLKQTAPMLGIAYKTVDKHKANIMRKLNLHSQIDLTLYAVREGYVIP